MTNLTIALRKRVSVHLLIRVLLVSAFWLLILLKTLLLLILILLLRHAESIGRLVAILPVERVITVCVRH